MRATTGFCLTLLVALLVLLSTRDGISPRSRFSSLISDSFLTVPDKSITGVKSYPKGLLELKIPSKTKPTPAPTGATAAPSEPKVDNSSNMTYGPMTLDPTFAPTNRSVNIDVHFSPKYHVQMKERIGLNDTVEVHVIHSDVEPNKELSRRIRQRQAAFSDMSNKISAMMRKIRQLRSKNRKADARKPRPYT